ncbi:uncharacterized protein [Euwallacea similis]|uniref:uncharacterized protein isoform X1 n=1 Tax=Euwallacea similis TaxID=1736056 RepID=UPI00344B0C22
MKLYKMCPFNLRTIFQKYIYLVLLTLSTVVIPKVSHASGAPTVNQSTKYEFERALDTFLRAYYDEALVKKLAEDAENSSDYLVNSEDGAGEAKRRQEEGREVEERRQSGRVDIYDQMLGDQPATEASVVASGNSNEDINKTRDRLRKESWVEYLKSQILSQLGRNNATTFTKPPEEPPLTNFNITQIIPKILNGSGVLDDDLITEKIRSFYPSCDAPQNQELDQWKDSDDIMNLYFDFDFNTDNKNSNIASATLRLYRVPQNNSNKVDPTLRDDCKNPDNAEDEKLLRISVYWYTKFQKKRKVKRRLSDSKVIAESSRWVELSVKPATKSWNRVGSKNLGLGILVEDQEGKALRADKYFKGASCMVGVSTPKPIPTIIRDASQADELDRLHDLSRRNSTTALHSDILLLPTVDICYLEFPENTDISHFDSARINACNLRKMHEESQRQSERERMERLATLHFPNNRHIRHQRQHRQSQMGELLSLKLDDVVKLRAEGRQMSDLERNMRSGMGNKQIVLTREEIESLQSSSNKDLKR